MSALRVGVASARGRLILMCVRTADVCPHCGSVSYHGGSVSLRVRVARVTSAPARGLVRRHPVCVCAPCPPSPFSGWAVSWCGPGSESRGGVNTAAGQWTGSREPGRGRAGWAGGFDEDRAALLLSESEMGCPSQGCPARDRMPLSCVKILQWDGRVCVCVCVCVCVFMFCVCGCVWLCVYVRHTYTQVWLLSCV